MSGFLRLRLRCCLDCVDLCLGNPASFITVVNAKEWIWHAHELRAANSSIAVGVKNGVVSIGEYWISCPNRLKFVVAEILIVIMIGNDKDAREIHPPLLTSVDTVAVEVPSVCSDNKRIFWLRLT
jgi:hypothetical protein